MAHDIFISHSSVNKVIADAVCAKLEAQGIRCWIAPRDVLAGNRYTAEIMRGIEESKMIVFVLSSSSNVSRQVYRELERAVNRGKIIIPFRLEAIDASEDVEYLIAGQHWIDAINPPIEERIDELAKVIKRHLQMPVAKPDIPGGAAQVGKTKPGPAAGLKRVLPLLAALGLVLVAALAAWFFLHRGPTDDTVQLNQPADHQVIIGDSDQSSLTFLYTLPSARLGEQADVQIVPEGKSPQDVTVSSESCNLPDGLEGQMKWRVRAIWQNSDSDSTNGDMVNGPWSPWRSFAFYRDRLHKILLTGKCIIGTAKLDHDNPITNVNQKDQPGGYEVDLLQAYFKQAAVEEKTSRPVIIQYLRTPTGNWDDVYFHMLQNYPDVDMLVSGITPTPQREHDWNVKFTVPSLKFFNVLVVLKGTKAVDHGTILLHTIGVADNTTNEAFLLRLFASDPGRVKKFYQPQAYNNMVSQLLDNKIDGFLIDQITVPALDKDHPRLAELSDIPVPLDPKVNNQYEYSTVAYALRPEDDDFLASLNHFIATDLADRKAILKKYLPDLAFMP